MAPQDALRIAQDFADLAGYASDILNDPNIQLTNQQAQQLNAWNTKLTQYSNNIAVQTALTTLAASQNDLNQITKATKDANSAAAALKADVTKLNSVMTILGDAVTLGASIALGPLGGVLAAAIALESAAS